MRKAIFVFMAILLLITSNWYCSKDENGEDIVNDYAQSFKSTVLSLESFVMKTQEYESANWDALTPQQKLKLIDEFIAAGNKFINDVADYEKYKGSSSGTGQLKSGTDLPCSPYDAIPDVGNGISPSFVKGVADLIAETKGDRDKIQQKYDKGEIDENTCDAALKQLAKTKTLKAYNFGVSAILGGGSGALTGAAIYSVGGIGMAMSAPAVIAVTAVGVTVGTGYYLISNWWYGVNKNSQEDKLGQVVIARGKIGDPIPTTLLSDGASYTLYIDGYAPVYIPSLALPAQGYKKTLEMKPVEISKSTKDTKVEVCMLEELYTANNCSEVLYVTATPNPPDPAPYQGVTVTATLFPPVAGCDISFSIVGTDGYTNSATYQSDGSGQASFYIPGGAEDVFDVVTITTSNGLSFKVTYTF